jgi:CheY-like chemotaxis protein
VRAAVWPGRGQAGEPFDAVFINVQMLKDGYATTRVLRKFFSNEQQLPVISLMVSVLSENQYLTLVAGMDDTIATF